MGLEKKKEEKSGLKEETCEKQQKTRIKNSSNYSP